MTDEGLGAWPGRRRAKSGADPALVFNGTTTSYALFADRADRLSAALLRLGTVAGDRVAYLGDNHPDFLETLFASARIGAVFVPLNTRLAAEELAYMIADAGARLLIAGSAQALLAAEATGALSAVRVLAVADLDAGAAAPELPEAQVRLDDPAMILYTSGTTGRPKGAVLSHGNLTWSALNVLVDYDILSTDRALMVSPLFHVASLGMGTLPAFLKGACVVLEERFDAGRALALIAGERITTLSGVPTTFQMMCEHADWATTDLSSLRVLTCGGSPVPMRVIEAFEKRGLAFTGGYGMTEASPGVTSLAPAHSRPKAGSAGLAHFFTEVRLRDASGADPGTDGVGEVEVRGPNVMHAYWNRPGDSADAFSDGGWFRSGDLGSLDAEGFLFISDRAKDMIISGGENIYPAEVERLILELPEVTGAAVIGVPDDRWGEVPIAVVTVRAGAGLSLEALRSHLEGRLARFKIPKALAVVDELPRTASGKVRKTDLRATFPRLP